jgi:hypothetical protein
MANEFKHKDPGAELTQAEFITTDGTGHIVESQATGDILYASSATVLKALAKGSNGDVLSLAAGIPDWTTSAASATVASTVVVIDTTDTSAYVALFDSATGSLAIKTDTGITYNAGTGMLTVTGLTGPLTGNASGTAATVTGGTQAAITSAANLVTVGTIGTGVWQGTVVAAAYLPDAGVAAQGVVELATAAETTTGTSAALAVTPDGLSQSVVFGTRYVQCVVVDSGTDIAEGNGKFFFHIPAGLNGMNLVETHARVATAGSGSAIQVQLFLNTSTTNAATGNDMLTNLLTIDDGELDSSDSSVTEDIDENYDDVDTNDMIRIDVDGNGGDSTIAKGLIVTLGFRLPD